MATKQLLTLDMTRKAEGIVKRMTKEDIVKALLFRSKKDFAIHYLLNNELHEEGPSARQIVASHYFGDEYEYGPADVRQKMFLLANPDMINNLASQVPEEECKMPTVKSTPKVAVKTALIDAAKKALSQGFTIDQVRGFLDLTDKEVEAITAE